MPDLRPQLDRHFELVTSITPDQVKLHGLFQATRVARQTTLDAAVVLHGLGGNFYSSSLNLGLVDALRELGMAVIVGNTRGHDGISMSPVSGRAQTIGAAYEIVDECQHDVAGWVRFLNERGFSQLTLLGHSLGAIKSLYAMAHRPQPSVRALVGLSATRLNHQALLNSKRGDDFQKWFRRAVEYVQQGRGDELLSVDFPFPTHMSATAYRDKYGPEDRYDWTRFVDQIQVPTLMMYGERELQHNAAFQGLWQQLLAIAQRRPNFTFQAIPSADHFYAGVHDRVTSAMQTWIRQHYQAAETESSGHR